MLPPPQHNTLAGKLGALHGTLTLSWTCLYSTDWNIRINASYLVKLCIADKCKLHINVFFSYILVGFPLKL